jgi:hypothetical protein
VAGGTVTLTCDFGVNLLESKVPFLIKFFKGNASQAGMVKRKTKEEI